MISLSDITNSPAAAQLVDRRYLDAAADSLAAHSKLLRSLISQKRMPDTGTPPAVIEALLGQLALMDSNNFPSHFGAGEREGRVFSSIVAKRHFYMSHGIGRSGDVTADQPKAAGSSLMSKLCNAMARDALHCVGLAAIEKAIVIPMCTGMTLALVLQYMRSQRKDPSKARFVIWPRIDQKTCLKCIEAAGLEPVVVELRKAATSSPQQHHHHHHHHDHDRRSRVAQGADDDEQSAAASASSTATISTESSFCLRVHPEDVNAAIERIGADNIACVLSTTSCFAPRVPDDPLLLARVCAQHSIPLVINNAYGVQSPAVCKRLNAAFVECSKKLGGLVACVQSCDKNFLVPVGGSVLGGGAAFVDRVAALYAGRASADPTTDLFVTLLEMGKAGWMRVQQERIQVIMPLFRAKAAEFAARRGEGIVGHEANDISFAITLKNFIHPHQNSSNSKSASSVKLSAVAGAPEGPACVGAEISNAAVSTGAASALAAASTPASAGAAGAATTWLGGALFRCGVSGPRVLQPPPPPLPESQNAGTVVAAGVQQAASSSKTTKVGKTAFANYGMHGLGDDAPPMLVMACAVGMTVEDVDGVMKRLESLYPVGSVTSSKNCQTLFVPGAELM